MSIGPYGLIITETPEGEVIEDTTKLAELVEEGICGFCFGRIPEASMCKGDCPNCSAPIIPPEAVFLECPFCNKEVPTPYPLHREMKCPHCNKSM